MDSTGSKPPPSLPPPETASPSVRPSALIVEADRTRREWLQSALGASGLGVRAVASLAEAERACRSSPYSLLLVHVELAAEGSSEQLVAIRAEQPGAGLVLIRSDPACAIPTTLDAHPVAALLEWPTQADRLCALAWDILRGQLETETDLAEATSLPAQPRFRGEVVLIADAAASDDGTAEMVQAALPDYELVPLQRLSEALRRLDGALPAAVFTRLSLGDARGLDCVRALRAAAPTTPVVVLAAPGEESMALEALRAGAQDYLLQRELTREALRRSALFAMERSHPVPAAMASANRSGACGPLAFDGRVRAALARAGRDHSKVALGVIRLQKVDLAHRHEALGALALDAARAVASNCLREYDSACWLEHNCLGVVMEGIAGDEGADAPARRLLGKLRKRVEIPNGSLELAVTVGIALFPSDADSAEDLIRCADMAATRGQAAGGNLVEYYDERLSSRLRARHRMMRLASRIVRRRKFLLRYEPQFSPRTDRLVSLEAQLHWHPQGGDVCSAANLIPLLEERGESRRLTHWMLAEACKQARSWRRRAPDVRVSVNLTLCQVTDRHLLSKLKSVLASVRVPPDCLELEISEKVLEQPAARLALEAVARLGVRLVVDGFSMETPLSCLAGLNIKGIKLGPRLGNGNKSSRDSEALTQAITQLAHSLKLEVTVLGVSSGRERDRLRRMGCDRAQGALYGGPEPAAHVLDRARDEGPPAASVPS